MMSKENEVRLIKMEESCTTPTPVNMSEICQDEANYPR